MKIQGRIIQIIIWEKRKSYFDVGDSDIPHDLIVVGNSSEFANPKGLKLKLKQYCKNYINSWRTFQSKSLDDFSFPISMWIKRPHNYKEDDLINVELNFTQQFHDSVKRES